MPLTSLVCAQMQHTYPSAKRASYQIALSHNHWVRDNPTDHMLRTSTDHHTSIASMAEESLPGSSKRHWTFKSTDWRGLTHYRDSSTHGPISSTLARPEQQHWMGRLDHLAGLGRIAPFHHPCPNHDLPWHGQRHLERRTKRNHSNAQAVLH
jgi:hypothetical protein